MVSNLAIGIGFALCGALIAWHRPTASTMGWLYAVGGVCANGNHRARPIPLAQAMQDGGASRT